MFAAICSNLWWDINCFTHGKPNLKTYNISAAACEWATAFQVAKDLTKGGNKEWDIRAQEVETFRGDEVESKR